MGPTGLMQNSPSGMAGYGSDSGKANSTTFSAVSAGDLQITNAAAQQAKTGQSAEQTVASLNRDTANTENAIKPIFDQQKVENEINAQVAITQAFGQQASKAVGDYAASQIKQASALMEQADKTSDPAQQQALRDQAQAINAQWGENGTLRIAAHTVIGGLTGNLQGAAGALVGTLTAPAVANALQQAGITGILATALTQIASTASGYAAGGGAGGASAFNEVTNNYLKHDEVEKYWKAVAACNAGDNQACSDRNSLKATSDARDAALQACVGVSSAECNDTRQMVRSAMAEFVRNGANLLLLDALSLGTKLQADNTLSSIEQSQGAISGLVNGLADTIVSLGKGLSTLAIAKFGDQSSPAYQQSILDIVETTSTLAALSDPDVLAQVLKNATASQREQIAVAYENGDAFALGQAGGETLSYLVGIGSIKNTAKVAEAVRASEARVLANAAKGNLFESSLLTTLNLDKNTQRITVTLESGKEVTVIPDALGTTIIEAKNVKYLSNSNQFRGYFATGKPIELYVSPGTTISGPLKDLIQKSNGSIQTFDLSTKNITKIYP